MMYKLCAACNKHYRKDSQAAIRACTNVLVTLQIKSKYKETLFKESDLTERSLFGRNNKTAGIVQATFKKQQFVEFLHALVSPCNEPWANEVRDKVFPKLLRIEDLEVTFGSEYDGENLWLSAEPLFCTYVHTLQLAAAMCAWLLFRTHTSGMDSEFMQIADEELHGLTYDFAALFKREAKEKVKATVGVRLRLACQDLVNITTAQPKRIEETESASGASGWG